MPTDSPAEDPRSGAEKDPDELLRSAAEGDRTAVARLSEQYLPALQGYIRKHAGQAVVGRESSSDLAQSVCREAFQGLAEGRLEYRGEAAFRQWLYRAADHKILNRHRFWNAEKRDVKRELRDAEDGAVTEAARHEATPSLEVMRDEAGQRVRASLDRLPERDREVIDLIHFRGFSHDQAAERLGITAAHSRVLLSRALARLTTRFEEDGTTPSVSLADSPPDPEA